MSSNVVDAYNLETLIEEGKNSDVSLKSTSLLEKIGDDVIVVMNIFNKYIDFIMPLTVPVYLTGADMQKYRYNPKRLSLDLYGVDDYWFLILRLNACSSDFNFNKTSLRLIDPSKLYLINKILMVAESDIEKNHLAIYKSE